MKTPTVILIALSAMFLALVSAQAQPSAGKIWIEGEHLFVNAPQRGVQAMNNANTRRPEAIGFIAIPGNVDMAVIGNVMYANHYDDLVAFDWRKYIEDSELVEMARFEDLFPNYREEDMAMGIGTIDINPGAPISKGGSMACFTFDSAENPQYLYAVSDEKIYAFDLSDPEQPRQLSTTDVRDGEVETIFVDNGRLFLGMPNGMQVYDLDNPASPVYEGLYQHLTGCDPVVAQGERAYVTVRSGSTCNSDMPINQLHVVNVANVGNPNMEGSFQLNNPHGLGVDQNLAFVCDGMDGLKVIDVSNPSGMRLLSRTNLEGNAYDVIVRPDRRALIVVSGDNISQYRYTSTGTLTRLSEFKLQFDQ